MKLNRFMMNSDFDSQKEQSVISFQQTIQQFTLAPREAKWFDTYAAAPSGSFFTNTSITSTFIPNISVPDSSVSIYKDDISGYIVGISVVRSDQTHYKMRVVFTNQLDTQNTIPTNTENAKVRFYVASAD